MSNKMIVHYAGGCGINVARAINAELAGLGDGYCDVDAHYLDTSTANVNDVPAESMWLVKTLDFTGAGMDGSGGLM